MSSDENEQKTFLEKLKSKFMKEKTLEKVNQPQNPCPIFRQKIFKEYSIDE